MPARAPSVPTRREAARETLLMEFLPEPAQLTLRLSVAMTCKRRWWYPRTRHHPSIHHCLSKPNETVLLAPRRPIKARQREAGQTAATGPTRTAAHRYHSHCMGSMAGTSHWSVLNYIHCELGVSLTCTSLKSRRVVRPVYSVAYVFVSCSTPPMATRSRRRAVAGVAPWLL